MEFGFALGVLWAIIIAVPILLNYFSNNIEEKGGYSKNAGKIDLIWLIGISTVILSIILFVTTYT